MPTESIVDRTLQAVVQPLRGAGRFLLSRRTNRAVGFDLQRLRTRLATRLRKPPQGVRPACEQLHLGCGGRRVQHFLNVDVRHSEYDVDLGSGRLPWESQAFTAVVSQHVIEHLDLQSQLLPLLQELSRVLRPGGEVWLSCPDMQAICRSYLDDGGAALLRDRQQRWPRFGLQDLPASQMVNELFHQSGEHLNLFDFTLLQALLRRAAFTEIERCDEAALLSRFPAFPARHDDRFTLYVRARKAAPAGELTN